MGGYWSKPMTRPKKFEWIAHRQPCFDDADRDLQVRLRTGDGSYTLVPWTTVAGGAQWAHSERWWEKNFPEGEVLSGWINDRLPEIHDSDDDGDVQLPDPDGEGEVYVHWADVVAGQTWRHAFGAGQHQQSPESGNRAFVSVVPYPSPGDYCLLAVANDGTAWELSSFGPVWQQLPALPQYDIGSTWKTGETFVPSTESIQEVTDKPPIIGVPIPLCVRLPEGDDLDDAGGCIYGYWDKEQGGGRWNFFYGDHACEEDTHWIPYYAEALPETCYKPANVN